MKRLLMLALIIAPTAVQADSVGTVYNKLLTTTYMCRQAIGVAHYQAVRSHAVVNFAKIVGNEEATRLVQGVDARLKADPRSTPKRIDAGKCLETINDLYFILTTIENNS